MEERDEGRDRQRQLAEILVKVIGIAVAIGAVIGLGSWALVKAIGLDEAESDRVATPVVNPPTALPTKALDVPGDDEPDEPETEDPDEFSTPPPNFDLQLNASPVSVAPMERINLTGQWPGHDAVGLLVQRKEGGTWSDFGVQASVRVGTFETYVLTGRPGVNVFRVYDPRTNTASNAVRITVG